MILITGASGNIGRKLVQLLSARGIPLRVIGRDTQKFTNLGEGIQFVKGDLNDGSIVRSAMQGATKLFLLPLFVGNYQEFDNRLIDEAVRANVSHVTMISSIAPENTGIGKRHRFTERLIRESGMTWTFLRAGSFMSNAFQWNPSIRSQKKVFTPIPDGILAPIAPRDLALAADLSLASTQLNGRTFALTGNQLQSTRDQVDILARVLSLEIECVEIPIETSIEKMRESGIPAWVVEAVAEMFDLIRRNQMSVRTDDVAQLLGAPPQTFESWCIEHREIFLR